MILVVTILKCVLLARLGLQLMGTPTAPTAAQRWMEGMRMSCDASCFEPLPCPKCNRKPLYVVWEHIHNGSEIHRFSCCGIKVGKYSKQDALAKWNRLALEYALKEMDGDGNGNL